MKLLWVWQDTYVTRRAFTHSKAQAKRAAARIFYRGKLGSKAYGSYRKSIFFLSFFLVVSSCFFRFAVPFPGQGGYTGQAAFKSRRLAKLEAFSCYSSQWFQA